MQSKSRLGLPLTPSPSPQRGEGSQNSLREALLVFAALVLCSLVGCGNADFFQKKIDAGRLQLQLSEDEKALETLSAPNDNDAPAEYHYLKALTLDRLGRAEAANAEIRRAVEAEAGNPKYKGLELRFRLFARDRNSVDQLIELNGKHASVGAVALFSTYAYQAKSLLLKAENKPQAAEFHEKRKQETLDTALTLAKDMPELHRDLITFAVQNGKHDEALSLANGLLALSPKSVPARNQKLQVLLLLKEPDDAAKIAAELYDEMGRQLVGAEAYASVLAMTSTSAEHDKEFAELRGKYPYSTTVLTKYATYLTRAGRLVNALELLDAAIQEQPNKSQREQLAFVAITLPLEIDATEYAEERLKRYRDELTDPLLIDFFEGRILFQKRQYHDAVQRMLNIVAAEKKNPGKSTALAKEAFGWVQRSLSAQLRGTQIQVAIDKTSTLSNDGESGAKTDVPQPAKPGDEKPLKEVAKPANETAPSSVK